ncbi:MAG: hypothetical protein PUC07_08545, partial [Solobacterium sp.]|nr:hypothetical protein [Solobacterium sp.]
FFKIFNIISFKIVVLGYSLKVTVKLFNILFLQECYINDIYLIVIDVFIKFYRVFVLQGFLDTFWCTPSLLGIEV